MHTYRWMGNLETPWQVGYYVVVRYAADWVVLSNHDTELAAMRRVNFLNGGSRE